MTDLLSFVAEIASGAIRVIDLTHTLTPEFPVIALPPELGQCAPFRMETVSRYDAAGPAWYWNNVSMNEHTGTHFDAPVHWISGRDLPDNAVDTIPAHRFIAHAVVIDCSTEATADADFLLTVAHIHKWEARHGRISAGAWCLFRTDWSRRGARDYANLAQDGAHTPGPTSEAVRFLVEERDVLGFGTETIGTDAGQAHLFNPPFPAHFIMHGKGRYGLQCLTNLDQLPPTGSVLVAAPLKIRHGSGSPLRVLALVAGP
jgi:kynurenine formamidase